MNNQADIKNKTLASEDEFDYLNIAFGALSAIIRNLPMLIVGPLVVGVVAYAIVVQMPKIYSSMSLVGPLEESLALSTEVILTSDVVLDGVLKRFDDYPGQALPLDQRRRYLAGRIKWTPASAKTKSRFYKLEVVDEDPSRAQALLKSLTASWLDSTKSKGHDRDRFEKLLQATESQISDLTQAISLILKNPALVSTDAKTGQMLPNVADMIKLRTESVAKSEDLKQALRGGSNGILFSPPTLPSQQSWPVKREVVSYSIIWSFGLLLGGVLLVFLYRFASTTPTLADKMQQLRLSIGFSRP